MNCKKNISRGCCFKRNEQGEMIAVTSPGSHKMEVFDWQFLIPNPLVNKNIVEIQFKNTRKGYFETNASLELSQGDVVVVESSPGIDVGIVSLTGDLVANQMKKHRFNIEDCEFKKVLRKAKPYDIEKWEEAIALEQNTMIRSRQIASDLNLKMKIGDVEYQGDRLKAIFYYIADERVDFRELIKVLAEQFRIRVEMKQIGARQEAGRIGGISACGRELCCSTWQNSFQSVTIGSARHQDISLNPQKLAGQCGKLKCCLNYEVDSYIDAKRSMPRLNAPLEAMDGTYHLVKTDIFKNIMWFSPDANSMAIMIPLTTERVQKIMALNRKGIKIDRLEDEALMKEVVVEPKYMNVVGEDSITRFDRDNDNKRRGGRNNNRNRNGKQEDSQTPNSRRNNRSGNDNLEDNKTPNSERNKESKRDSSSENTQEKRGGRNNNRNRNGNREDNQTSNSELNEESKRDSSSENTQEKRGGRNNNRNRNGNREGNQTSNSELNEESKRDSSSENTQERRREGNNNRNFNKSRQPRSERASTPEQGAEPSSPRPERTSTRQGAEPSSPRPERTSTPQGAEPSSPRPERTSTRQGAKPSSPRLERTSTPQGAEPSSPRLERTSTPQGAEPSSPRLERTSTRQGAEPSSPRPERTSTRQGAEPSSPRPERTSTRQGAEPSSPRPERTSTPQGAERTSTPQGTEKPEGNHDKSSDKKVTHQKSSGERNNNRSRPQNRNPKPQE